MVNSKCKKIRFKKPLNIQKNNKLYLYLYVKRLFLACYITLIYGLYINNIYMVITALFCSMVLLFFFFYITLNNYMISNNNSYFISPSSSKVVSIKNDSNELMGTYNRINTYLSPLDEHFMIAPCDCYVEDVIHKRVHKSDSERLRHIFRDSDNELFYLDQIVSKPLHWGWIPSLIYQRCVSFVKKGQLLRKGEHYGLIRFGSNMEYGLPKSYKILASPKDKFRVGMPFAVKIDKNNNISYNKNKKKLFNYIKLKNIS